METIIERAQSPEIKGTASPVLLGLRAATEIAHRRLEARHALSADFARADYENVLCAYYGFYKPLEKRLSPFVQSIGMLDWDRRLKTAVLERDLSRLGYSLQAIEALQQCPALPRIECATDALGCLYVLEGSTLGGRVLSGRVLQRIGLDPQIGAAFLHAYGDRTAEMWRRFIECLDLLENQALQMRAYEAARSTFETFEAWLGARGALQIAKEQCG